MAKKGRIQPAPPETLPEAGPRMPLVEFEGVCGIDRVTFAGFRAWVAVNGHVKHRSLSQWKVLYEEYLNA